MADGKLYDSDWGKTHEADASRRFTATLQTKFPLGSDEAVMIAALLQQGFRYLPGPKPGCIPIGTSMPVGIAFVPCPLYDPKHLLEFTWTPHELPVGFWGLCSQTLGVKWDARDGRITRISGFFGGDCA